MSYFFPKLCLVASLALIPILHADQTVVGKKKVSVKVGVPIDLEVTKSVYALVESGDETQALPLLKTKTGIDLGMRDAYGNTFLHYASYKGEMEVIKWLMAKGADVNTPRFDGCTPLHLAVMGGHQDAVEYLLAHKANINAISSEWGTPLHVATFSANHVPKSIADLLVAKRADVTIKNQYGLTPFEWEGWEKAQSKKNEAEFAEERRIKAQRRAQYDNELRAQREAKEQAENRKIEAENARIRAENAALHSSSSSGYWQMGVEATQRDLANMQKADAARRNADYRRQNNCSGGDTRSECR